MCNQYLVSSKGFEVSCGRDRIAHARGGHRGAAPVDGFERGWPLARELYLRGAGLREIGQISGVASGGQVEQTSLTQTSHKSHTSLTQGSVQFSGCIFQ